MKNFMENITTALTMALLANGDLTTTDYICFSGALRENNTTKEIEIKRAA